MTTPPPGDSTETTLTQDLLHAARYYLARFYLGGRRGLLILASVAVIAGLVLNWSWLVAAGIAPILLAVLPCLAMCALGLCMHRAGSKSCAPRVDAPEADRLAGGPDTPPRLPDAGRRAARTPDEGSDHG